MALENVETSDSRFSVFSEPSIFITWSSLDIYLPHISRIQLSVATPSQFFLLTVWVELSFYVKPDKQEIYCIHIVH